MEQFPSKKHESAEKIGKTKILLLRSSYFGEANGEKLVQIEKEFDVKEAKKQFESEVPSGEDSLIGDVRHAEFATWLIQKGLAQEVEVVDFHEGD